jgi:protein-S-isoprenylcysteine O-methyltransferase Ste14
VILRVIIFILVSIGLSFVSRSSLRVPRSHGFYRFFAWEFILALILLNIGDWFHDPFASDQVISWILLIVSAFLAWHSVQLLRVVGNPNQERKDDTTTIGFEKTTTLVTVGAYRYIRHPMYGSLLFFAWGVFFKDPSWLGGFLVLVATTCLVATARVEEAENIRFFGPAYQAYKEKTKMFIPYVY